MAATGPPPLSAVDHLFIGYVMSLVLHYPERLDTGRLAASLEKVLEAVPLLAGGLVEREDGHYGVRPLSELQLADPHQGFLVTTISRLPFGVLDLGQGPATWARLPVLTERTAAIQQAEEELEVSLLLPPASAPG